MNNTPSITKLPPVVDAGDREYVVEFESITELVGVARSPHLASEHNRRHVRRLIDQQAGTEWMNYATHEKIDGWLTNPKAELVEAVQSVVDEIEVELPERRRRKTRRHLEDGDELDPEAVVTRRIDGWSRVDRVQRPKHHVTVGVNTAVNGYMDQRDLLWRGATAVAVADALGRLGASVELVGFEKSADVCTVAKTTLLRFPVKKADEPLDIGTAALVLADIGFFRLVVMSAEAIVSPGLVHSHQGMPVEAETEFDYAIGVRVTNKERALAAVFAIVSKFKSRSAHV